MQIPLVMLLMTVLQFYRYRPPNFNWSTRLAPRLYKMDIGKKFVEFCKADADKTEAIVAIELLISVIKQGDIRTVQELTDLINNAVKQMRQTDKSNSSVKSACELFQRFITLAVLDTVGDFEGVKRVILERADLFLKKVSDPFFIC